jgi:hypothetical protein
MGTVIKPSPDPLRQHLNLVDAGTHRTRHTAVAAAH